MNVIVVCFIYPLIKDFLNDFFESIKNQSYRNFDLLIFEDGFEGDYSNLNIKKIVMRNDSNLSIPEVRKHVIKYAINKNYDLLIFCDADDVMGADRIESIVNTHTENKDKYGFYYNDLFLLDSREDVFKGMLPEEITEFSDLEDYNFIGMSHTALNIYLTKNIWENLPVNDRIIAFDWYMHSYLLIKGFKGRKVDTTTYYRIYDENTAGLPDILNEASLKQGIQVKSVHYEMMSRFDKKFKEKEKKIKQLKEYLEDNPERIKNYVQNTYINRTKFVFWWQNIRLLEEYLDD
jgi:hypothetical protein